MADEDDGFQRPVGRIITIDLAVGDEEEGAEQEEVEEQTEKADNEEAEAGSDNESDSEVRERECKE